MIHDSDFDGIEFKHHESDTIELKQSINNNGFNKYRETLCAFLNTKGGHLIFGIKNDLTIVGVSLQNTQIDKFVCMFDQIISGGLIMCWNVLDPNRVISKISPDSIKTKIIVNSQNKKFIIVTAEPSRYTKYKLTDGSIFYRLNASNYYEKTEQIYKYSDLCLAVKQAEHKVNVINCENIAMFQKILQEKEEEIAKSKVDLEAANNLIMDYQTYLIKPLVNKLDDTLSSKDDQSIVLKVYSYMCGFLFDVS